MADDDAGERRDIVINLRRRLVDLLWRTLLQHLEAVPIKCELALGEFVQVPMATLVEMAEGELKNLGLSEAQMRALSKHTTEFHDWIFKYFAGRLFMEQYEVECAMYMDRAWAVRIKLHVLQP